MDILSRIHGYLLTYPWIFHHVSVDISLRIHGYASFSILKTCFSGKYFVTLRSKQKKNLNLSSYGKIHQTRIQEHQ